MSDDKDPALASRDCTGDAARRRPRGPRQVVKLRRLESENGRRPGRRIDSLTVSRSHHAAA